ncbi:hypothetical protein RUM43_002326 [Polyplax serrata]|uniref:Uncharacterized protein n=1 Tax=Polyplax serrata TaxID=468196 RepID=A0AAN8PFU1_POLSC
MSEEEANTRVDQTQPHLDKVSSVTERVVLSKLEKESLTKEEWAQKWLTMELYVNQLEDRLASSEAELVNLRNTEERSKQQIAETLQREKILIRRVANKDHEIQDYVNQIAELKAGQAPGAAALRSALLDPAVNLLLYRLRQEITSLKTRLEETQNELSAWKFTPDSNTGKRLMAKCRLLYQENEELGRVVSSGRLAKLEGDLALQKSFSEEVKKSQSELDEFLQDLDEDVEGMQSTIYVLQQELRKSKEALKELQQGKESSPNNNESVLKGDETNNRTESAEFRTGNDMDRLTNGNHSALCGSRTTNQSNKVLDPQKTDLDVTRTNHDESASDSCKIDGKFAEEAEDHSEGTIDGANDVNSVRKRTFDETNDSDSIQQMKKTRRGSELSLDFNEDELCLMNGEAKQEDH